MLNKYNDENNFILSKFDCLIDDSYDCIILKENHNQCQPKHENIISKTMI